MADTSGIRAGRAYVEIGADDTTMRQALARSQAFFESWGRAITASGLKLVALGAGLAAPFVAATAAFSNMGSELALASLRTGITVEKLSLMKYAAQQAGVEFDSLQNAIQKMNRNLSGLSPTGGTAAKALRDIGVSAASLQGLSPDQKFERIADAISKVPDPALRAAAAMSIFGSHGGTAAAQLLPLLLQGQSGMYALYQRASQLGQEISTTDAFAALAFKQALQNLWDVVAVGSFRLGAELAPAIRVAINLFIAADKAVTEFANAHRKAFSEVVIGAAGLSVSAIVAGTSLIVLGQVLDGVGSVIGFFNVGIGLVVRALGILTLPIRLIASAFASLLTTAADVLSAVFWATVAASARAASFSFNLLASAVSGVVSAGIATVQIAIAGIVYAANGLASATSIILQATGAIVGFGISLVGALVGIPQLILTSSGAVAQLLAGILRLPVALLQMAVDIQNTLAILGQFFLAVGANFGVIVSQVAVAMAAIATVTAAGLADLLVDVAVTLGAVIAAIAGAAAIVAAPLLVIGAAVLAAFAIVLPGILHIVNSVLVGVVGALGSLIRGVESLVRVVIAEVQVVGVAFVDLWNIVVDGADNAASSIITAFSDIKSIFSGLAGSFAAVWNDIGAGASAVATYIMSAFGGLAEFFGVLGQYIVQILNGTTSLAQAWAMVLQGVSTVGVAAWNVAKEEIKGAWLELKLDAVQIWNEIGGIIQKAMLSAVEAVKDVWADAIAYLSEELAQLKYSATISMINAKEAVGLISADEANKQRYAAGSEFASSSEDAEVAKAKAKMQAQLDYEDAAKKVDAAVAAANAGAANDSKPERDKQNAAIEAAKAELEAARKAYEASLAGLHPDMGASLLDQIKAMFAAGPSLFKPIDPNAGSGFDQVLKPVSSGTFNTSALFGFGAQKVQDPYTKASAMSLEELLRIIGNSHSHPGDSFRFQ